MNVTQPADVDVKQRVRRHWSQRAAEFDERPHHGLHSEAQHQAWLTLLGQLAATSPARVLDLGCGTGFLSLMLSELGHTVTGIDISTDMIALAQEKAATAGRDVEWRVGDVEHLDDADGSYDLVVARHLIWTLPNPAQAVREWQRVLAPGGRVALVEGHWENQQVNVDYEQIHTQLPFFGGVPSERLAQFLQEERLQDVAVEPLMDAVLWGEQPKRPRYLVTGRAG